MADNVTLPGTGERVASRDVSYSGETASMQVVGLATLAGADDAKVPTDVSPSAPLPVAVYGELVEALEALRIATNSLTKSIGYALPNLQGQPIFEARQATAANLNATVTGSLSSVTSVTSVFALQNQQQVGGFNANDQIPAFMHLQADTLRRNILVT